MVRRPVLIVGPLWELVTDKLVNDFPNKFSRVIPEAKFYSQSEIENVLQNNDIVDVRRKLNYFEATTVDLVKEVCDKVIEFSSRKFSFAINYYVST